MQMSPIVKKDIKVQSRSMRISWGLFAYELILALVFFFSIILIQQESRYSDSNVYASMVWLYPTLAVTQLVILGMVVPVRTASSISGERERQTFDIMMTTSMTPFAIVMGKVLTAIVQSMFYVVASLPIMALSFVIGGMSWSYLFGFFGIALVTSFFSASIGILCSAICKKSISAVIMSYVFYLLFFVGTFLPYLVCSLFSNAMYNADVNGLWYHLTDLIDRYLENAYLPLLLNPILYLVEFFARVMTGSSVVSSMSSTYTRGPINFVTSGYWWMILSTVLFLAVSYLFLWIASRLIDPVKKRHGKKLAAQRKAG